MSSARPVLEKPYAPHSPAVFRVRRCHLFFLRVVRERRRVLGHRLSVTQTATGTILAAFGTALPESVVTFVAVALGHSPAEKDRGIGAALGGPLTLSRLAYGVVGLTLMGSKSLHVTISTE